MRCTVVDVAVFVVVVVVLGSPTYVEEEVNAVADRERVDQAETAGKDAVGEALVAVTFVRVAFFVVVGGICPVSADTAVDDGIVFTAGVVSAPPVGEVQHHVESRTDVVETLFVFSVDGSFVEEHAGSVFTVGHAFD